jgi:hypothetical protein
MRFRTITTMGWQDEELITLVAAVTKVAAAAVAAVGD